MMLGQYSDPAAAYRARRAARVRPPAPPGGLPPLNLPAVQPQMPRWLLVGGVLAALATLGVIWSARRGRR